MGLKFPAIALLARPLKHHVTATGAIDRSLRRAGYRTRPTFDVRAPEPIIFCWSWGKAATARETNPSAIICCLDHGYTRERGRFINTGWSVPGIDTGLNGFAEHAVVDDGGERLRKMGWDAELKPPRKATGLKRALVLGQVYGDAMILGQVADYRQWLHERVRDLQDRGWDTTFRPHPVMVRRGNALERYGNLGRPSVTPDLWVDLSQNDLAVALNSNGLVAGYLDGMPVEAYNKGTMLGPLMDGTGPVIDPRDERRERWFQRLAWTQWTVEELDNGTWARYHLPIMHRIWETGVCKPWHDTRLS